MSKFQNPFQEKIEEHLLTFKTEHQYLPPTSKKEWYYQDIGDNLFPPVKHGFLQHVYDTGMPLHDYVNHVRSSQIFCVNVFYPLLTSEEGQRILLQTLSNKIGQKLESIKKYEFEFITDSDLLGEWKNEDTYQEDYVTAVDLYLQTSNDKKEKYIFLFEVKFTEDKFSTCGGFKSRANREETKEICTNSARLYENFNLCYLHGGGGLNNHHRKYFELLPKENFKQEAFNESCPFIDVHQCLRNHALLRAINNDDVAGAYFVLLHHDQNAEICNEWKKYKAILEDDVKNEIFTLPAGELIKNSTNPCYKKYFKDRYQI